MKLVFVTDDFAVDPQDVACLEKFDHWRTETPSGSSILDHSGTIVVQKNGRKTYLRGLSVKECHALIFCEESK